MSDGIPSPGNYWEFAAEEVLLYGVKLNQITGENFALVPLSPSLRLMLTVSDIAADKDLTPSEVAVAAIYGYAFEGHCYRLDRPRILIFTSDAYRGGDLSGKKGEGVPAIGCGFDSVPGYTMWRIRSQDTLIELDPSFGTVEKLLLDASLPGRRAPNTYNSTMQVAHRGGRLQTP